MGSGYLGRRLHHPFVNVRAKNWARAIFSCQSSVVRAEAITVGSLTVGQQVAGRQLHNDICYVAWKKARFSDWHAMLELTAIFVCRPGVSNFIPVLLPWMNWKGSVKCKDCSRIPTATRELRTFILSSLIDRTSTLCEFDRLWKGKTTAVRRGNYRRLPHVQQKIATIPSFQESSAYK